MSELAKPFAKANTPAPASDESPSKELMAYLTALTHTVDAALRDCLGKAQKPGIPPRLAAAMNYCLQGRGKRLRPVLCLASARLCRALLAETRCEVVCEFVCEVVSEAPLESPGPILGSAADLDAFCQQIMPVALALEMIHTYSLIHDDLPALDNDDLRRGRPSCHKAYDEATAILAGDGLLTDAFDFMCQAALPCGSQAALPAERVLAAVRIIAQAAGSSGMVGGQMLDMEATSTQPSFQERPVTEENLTALTLKKTAALLQAGCEAGAVLAGAGPELCAQMRAFGTALGMAYQMTDDILDEVSDTVTLGKPAGSDKAQGKWTWTALLGLELCKSQALQLSTVAEEALNAACAQVLPLSAPANPAQASPKATKKPGTAQGDKSTGFVINQDIQLLRHLARALVYRSF